MKPAKLIILLILFYWNICFAQNKCSVKFIKKIEVPNGGNAEIIQYISSKKILVAANFKNHYLDFYKVNSFSTGDIEPIANIKINSEPTSVAANLEKLTGIDLGILEPEVFLS